MTYINLLIATCISMLGTALVGCTSPLPPEEMQAGPPLWQVSDADTTIYLFGLPNIIDSEIEWRNAAFDKALAAANLILLESDRQSPQAHAKLQQTIPEIGMFGDDRNLTRSLDDQTTAQLKEVVRLLGIPLQAIEKLKPWLAANQLQSTMMQRQGLVGGATPTSVIIAEAKELDTPVSYFEEPTTLLTKVAELPEDTHIRMLEQSLDVISNSPDQPKELLSLWSSGDVDGLAESLHGDGEWADETVRRVMLLERNDAWQSQLEDMLANETGVIFVAVGIGHLVGEDSLVMGLIEEGYQVERR